MCSTPLEGASPPLALTKDQRLVLAQGGLLQHPSSWHNSSLGSVLCHGWDLRSSIAKCGQQYPVVHAGVRGALPGWAWDISPGHRKNTTSSMSDIFPPQLQVPPVKEGATACSLHLTRTLVITGSFMKVLTSRSPLACISNICMCLYHLKFQYSLESLSAYQLLNRYDSSVSKVEL